MKRSSDCCRRPLRRPEGGAEPPTTGVLFSLFANAECPAPTYAALGAELGMTASEAHAAVERAVAANLAIKDGAGKPAVVRAALRAFVRHGARYCFPATQGGLSRGVPTDYAASPLSEQIRPGNDPPPVWPWKKGTARGIAFHPLYPNVPEAAERNLALGELLALFDAVRGGSAREQALALALLERAAEQLGEALLEQLVFVGGAVAGVSHGSGDAGDPAHPGCGCDLPRDCQV